MLGRAVVFDAKFIREILGVRVSPLGVVDEPKFRIIHDLTFASASRSSVNHDTDFSQAPECLLGHVLTDIVKRVLFLRQLHGVAAEIMLCRVDVKEAFRQVHVAPSGASAFTYVFEGQAVVDLRCQFGWRSAPGFWSLSSSALEHSHTHTSFQTSMVTAEGAAAVQLVKVVPPEAGRAAIPVPADCRPVDGEGGYAGSPYWVRYYVDDGVLVEVRFFKDGRRCLRAVQSLASDHFRLLGSRGTQDPLLSPSKITHFETRLEVLGWVLDTQQLTITMTTHKQEKLARLLHVWPTSRKVATARQVSQLTGFLMHVSFALRPGKFFVGRLVAAAGQPSSAVFTSGAPDPNKRLVLGTMFHDELDFWRWFVNRGLTSRGGFLCSPMFHVVSRPPDLCIFTDASPRAVGGYCQQTGHVFRYDLSDAEQSRFIGSSKHVKGVNDISINVLELLGMFMGAWLLAGQQRDVPRVEHGCVLLRGDNEASVAWIQRCRGGKEPRSGALMRMLGALEVSSGWCFQALHVPGVLNSTADGISRWEPGEVLTNLRATAPHVPWQVVSLGAAGRALCSSVLATSSSAELLRARLSGLTWGFLGPG